jgi:hypothetical protein
VSAWREKLHQVHQQIYGKDTSVGNLSDSEKRYLEFVPNNSNIGESFVGSASYSIKQAGFANTLYHNARAQLIRNEIPDEDFVKMIGPEGMVIVRKYVEIIRSMSDKKQMIKKSYKQLYNCYDIIEKAQYSNTENINIESRNISQVDEDDENSINYENNEDVMENTQQFESLNTEKLMKLSNSKLKELLVSANLAVGKLKKRFMVLN